MDKTVATAQEAVAYIVAGSTIAVGGFGLCGIPSVLLEALLRSDADASAPNTSSRPMMRNERIE
jgi:3-oxoacid CoA-transferase subunit A